MCVLVLFQLRFSNSQLIQLGPAASEVIHIGSSNIFTPKGLHTEGRQLQAGRQYHSTLLHPAWLAVLASPAAFQGTKELENRAGNGLSSFHRTAFLINCAHALPAQRGTRLGQPLLPRGQEALSHQEQQRARFLNKNFKKVLQSRPVQPSTVQQQQAFVPAAHVCTMFDEGETRIQQSLC